MRKVMAAVAALAATLALAGQALGQAQKSAFHPTKTVTIIVPYSPGGGTDVVGRLMAKSLEEMWGQPVIIDNQHRRQRLGRRRDRRALRTRRPHPGARGVGHRDQRPSPEASLRYR